MTHLQANPDVLASLKDTVVVLTGGATGIGKSAVELFAKHGAKVVFGDVQDEVGNKTAAAAGPNVTYQHCNAASYTDQLALFETAFSKHGRVDIAVANAGVAVAQSMVDPNDDWRKPPILREIDINLNGCIFTARIAHGYFRESGKGGDIIFTSSVSGFKESGGLATYTASKHGVLGLVRGLNMTAAPENIRVNAVCPWMTKTNMSHGLLPVWEQNNLPTNEPEDIATAILICASANRGSSNTTNGTNGTTNGASGQQTHGGAVLPFAGKILFVGGGESYEFEDKLQALEPEWLGKGNSDGLTRGQYVLLGLKKEDGQA